MVCTTSRLRHLLVSIISLNCCTPRDVGTPSATKPPTATPDANSEMGPSGVNQVTVGSSVGTQKERQITWRFLVLQGDVELNHRAADKETPIGADSVITTGPKSRAVLNLDVGLFLEMLPQSSIHLGRSPRKQSSVDLIYGGLLSSVPPSTSYEVTTRHVLVGSEGGGHLFVSEPRSEQSYVCVCDGAMQVTTADATYDHLVQVPVGGHKGFMVTTRQGHQSVEAASLHGHSAAQLGALDNVLPVVPPGTETDSGKATIK